jgi:hypothetical protein
MSSEVIRGHQKVIRGHQRSSEVIRGHQRKHVHARTRNSPVSSGGLFVAGGGIGIQLSGKVSKPHMICQLPDHQLAYMTSRSTDLRHLMREAIRMPSERQSEDFEID